MLHNAQNELLLSANTVATNATHANGLVELDVHNIWGMMEEQATHAALLEINPGLCPFIISRSLFSGSGRVTATFYILLKFVFLLRVPD